MMMSRTSNSQFATPSPEGRHPGTSGLALSIGLFGAPFAWILQFSLSEPLAAQACYPRQMPLSAPLWPGLSTTLAVIGIVFLALALVSGLIAWRSWRRFKNQQALLGGQPSDLTTGRDQFLLKLSLMSSLIFNIAIVFNIFAVLLVSPCSSWF